MENLVLRFYRLLLVLSCVAMVAAFVTVSLGIAEWDPRIQEPDELVKRADEKLYEAKRGGRNQVRV